MEPQVLREKLIKEKDDLDLILKELSSEESAIKDIGSDLAPEVSDLSDQYEAKQNIYTQKELIVQRLGKIKKALDRFEQGTYGQCQKCGNPIEPMRLKIDPANDICRQCSL